MTRPRPIIERLLEKIDFSASDCWEWTAARNEDGYGRVAADGKNRQAHRVMYELLIGSIPAGMQIDHLCRNRACVNPDHLEPVTNAENARRGRGSITHCPQGHPYSGDNLQYYHPQDSSLGPFRRCRACKRADSLRRAHL